jgi:hypothetical protein
MKIYGQFTTTDSMAALLNDVKDRHRKKHGFRLSNTELHILGHLLILYTLGHYDSLQGAIEISPDQRVAAIAWRAITGEWL